MTETDFLFSKTGICDFFTIPSSYAGLPEFPDQSARPYTEYGSKTRLTRWDGRTLPIGPSKGLLFFGLHHRKALFPRFLPAYRSASNSRRDEAPTNCFCPCYELASSREDRGTGCPCGAHDEPESHILLAPRSLQMVSGWCFV